MFVEQVVLPTEASPFSETVASMKEKRKDILGQQSTQQCEGEQALGENSLESCVLILGRGIPVTSSASFLQVRFRSRYKLLFCMCESAPARCEVERGEFNRLAVDSHRSSHTILRSGFVSHDLAAQYKHCVLKGEPFNYLLRNPR